MLLSFLGASLASSLFSPPVYGQTAGAWNIHRQGAGNDLNFYYGLSGLAALQLNTGGDMRARRMVDFDSANFVTDPNSLSVMSGIRLGDSATYAGTANALTVRRAGADNAIYQTLINEGTVTHTIRSGGAGLRKDLVFTNDAGGNYSFSNQVTVPSLNLPTNASLINMPEFTGNTSYSGTAAGGNMPDGIPWYFGIGREPGGWPSGGPYPNLIINNHTGIALSSHGGFVNGGITIWEELNTAGTNWQAKGKEVAKFRHDNYGGSNINGKLLMGGFNDGDGIQVYSTANDKLAFQTLLNGQPNNGYGGDGNNILALQPVTGRVGIGIISPYGKLTVASNGGSDGLTIDQFADNSYTIQTYIDGQWANRATYAGGCCNPLVLQPDVGNVVIGSSAGPTSKLHVQGTARVTGALATNGWDPVGCGTNPYDGVAFGNCLAGSAYVQSDLRVGRWIGINGYNTLGCGNANAMCLGGNGWASAAFISASDIRTKKNIRPIKDALNKVLGLEGVNFEFAVENFPGKQYPTDLQIGFIAQQVEPILPEVVEEGPDNMKSIAYAQLTALLVEAVKEQNTEVKNLKEDLENQRNTNNILNEELQTLRSEFNQLKEDVQSLKE